MKNIKTNPLLIVAAFCLSSCDKYLDITPVGKVIASTTSEYRALLTEGYMNYPYMGALTYTALLSDEAENIVTENILGVTDRASMPFTFTWRYGSNMYEYSWQSYYSSIFLANAIIEQVDGATVDGGETREQLKGEAYALRAYNHFILANLYGKWYDPATASSDRTAPLAEHIDVSQTYLPSTVEKMYTMILSDLNNAYNLMEMEKQADPSINYRFSKLSAKALESRVKLYMGDWEGAYDAAKEVLPAYALSDMNLIPTREYENYVTWGIDIFADYMNPELPWKATSSEAILALDRPFAGLDGDFVTMIMALSADIIALYDADDLRGAMRLPGMDWNTFMPTGEFVVRRASDRCSIRVSELYLTAAEAGVQIGSGDKITEARTLLKALIDARLAPAGAAAKKAAIDAMTAPELLQEIYDERVREFLMEGHRWFDLRRTTRPSIIKTYSGATYTLNAGDSRYTLPFPSEALKNNPHLSE